MQTYEQHSSTKLASIVIAVIVIAGVVLFADHLKREASEHVNAQPVVVASSPTPSTSNSPSTAMASSGYKDGTYNASASYYVPHGNEQITVNVTLQSGTITNVSVQNSEGDRDSAQYQEDFASAYKSYVVGKKISGLSLNTVAGASDTTAGFNAAIARISSQAKA